MAAPVGSDWTCKKCGYGKDNPPVTKTVISWHTDKPGKILILCQVCGFSEYINAWS